MLKKDKEVINFSKQLILFLGMLLFVLFVITALEYPLRLLNPSEILIPEDVQTAAVTLASSARIATLLLAMLISGMAIALPLAANNYTPRLIKMFVRDPINELMFFLLLNFGAISMWSSWMLRQGHIPRFSLGLCLFLYIVSLSALVPYLIHVLSFLNPDSILCKIRNNAQYYIKKATNKKLSRKKLLLLKQEVIEAIDSISNIALRSLDRQDRQAFSSAMDNLQFLAIYYSSIKPRLHPDWHNAEVELFLGMLQPAKEAIQEKKVTFELYLSQVLLNLFEFCAHRIRDSIDTIAFIVFRITSHYIPRNDYNAIYMFCALFNSVMRFAINIDNVRIIYNILPHYRNIAKKCIDVSPKVTIRISHHIYEYAIKAYKRSPDLNFAVELCAYELCNLIILMEESPERDVVFELLKKTPIQNQTLMSGVLKARLVAAAKLTSAAQRKELLTPLEALPDEKLQKIREDLTTRQNWLYWEITSRQINIDFIPPDLCEAVTEMLDCLQKRNK